MGTVFRATVSESVHGLARGDRVAVKTIRERALEHPVALERFAREGRVGLRVDHPNVVRTHDVGTFDAGSKPVHAIVMEYVEGRTLDDLRRELGHLPEGLCRHVGREMARGLAAIHGVGAVHRDVKPANVLITPDDTVKLMDLGIARIEEGATVSVTGAFVGSLAYAAPEQLQGEVPDIDARVDLWATGVTLYELVAGRHPFSGDASARVVQRILSEHPPRLRDVRPELSPFLDELVRSLLARNPERRPASATELAEILEGAEESAWWIARVRDSGEHARRHVRRLRLRRDTSVHGRGRELEILRAGFEDARAGNGNLVILEGEAGIGKSRIVDEFIAEMEHRGEDVDVLLGSYAPGGAATATEAFAEAFLERFGAERLEDALARHLLLSPALIPAFAALLRGETAPEGSEPLRRDSVQTTFVHAARSLAEERPTVLWVEDLHCATDGGRGLLTALTMAAPGHRLLLIATTRPELPADWLASLDQLPQARRTRMERLGPAEIEEIVAESLSSRDTAAELVKEISERSDGNPFFALEILEELRAQGVLRETDDGSWRCTRRAREIRIPPTVMNVIGARLAALPDEDREVLDVASCIGFDFDPLLVAEVMEIARIPLLTRLARIERRHRLVHSTGRRLHFDHHQVQEYLYRHVPEVLREELHGAIADRLEQRAARRDEDAPDAVDGDLCVKLCDHLLRGGRGERALAYLDRAQRYLEHRYHYEHSVALADRALAVPGLLTGRRRTSLIVQHVLQLRHLGRNEAMDRAIDDAVAEEEAGAYEPTGDVALAHGAYLQETGRLEEALVQYDRAAAQADTAGDDRMRAEVAAEHAFALDMAGRMDESLARYRQALDIAETCGFDAVAGRAAAMLGGTLWGLGRMEEAEAHLVRSLACMERLGDRRNVASVHGTLGIVLATTGRLAEAREHMETQLRIAREVGARDEEDDAYGSLALLLWTEGRTAQARDRMLRRIAVSRELGEPRTECMATLNLGYLMSRLGANEEAGERLTSAIASARKMDARRPLAFALIYLAIHLTRRGEPDRARRHVDESHDLARAIREAQVTAMCQSLRGEIAMRCGNVDEARSHLREARELADEFSLPGLVVRARANLASIDPDEVEPAAAALAELEAGMELDEAMECHVLLYRATSDPAHLAEAYRRLMFLRDHAPEAYRESMLSNVPIHREIVAAWTASGASPGA
jgi:tetratricopeptide (TPR) repeat protein